MTTSLSRLAAALIIGCGGPTHLTAARLAAAEALGFDALKQRHLQDYRNLFGRVRLDLGSTPSEAPTSELLEKYQAGDRNTRIEELLFHYGRYLLIASSREASLPASWRAAILSWMRIGATGWSTG
jgi:alpha-L-fucosidase 2